jgi:hypothetical protein
MNLKCKLEKQKELTDMELAIDTDSDAHEEDTEVKAELQEEQEEASVGEKSKWDLQHAGSSEDADRFTGHERGLRKSNAPTISNVSSPLSIFMLCFTVVIPLLGRWPVGEELNWGLPQCAGSSRDSHRFTGHETGLRKSEALTVNKESSPLNIFMLCFTAVKNTEEEGSVGEKSKWELPKCAGSSRDAHRCEREENLGFNQ